MSDIYRLICLHLTHLADHNSFSTETGTRQFLRVKFLILKVSGLSFAKHLPCPPVFQNSTSDGDDGQKRRKRHETPWTFSLDTRIERLCTSISCLHEIKWKLIDNEYRSRHFNNHYAEFYRHRSQTICNVCQFVIQSRVMSSVGKKLLPRYWWPCRTKAVQLKILYFGATSSSSASKPSSGHLVVCTKSWWEYYCIPRVADKRIWPQMWTKWIQENL